MNNDNIYKNIEKFIDPTKLAMEIVPDIYEEDKGNILQVNNYLEPEWIDKKNFLSETNNDINIIIKDIKSILVTIGKMQIDIDDKVSNGDFNGALQLIESLTTTIEYLSGRIEMSIEESKILGAYVPGSNDLPTEFWNNTVQPRDGGVLRGFLFSQDSGWIGHSIKEFRLMMNGDQIIEISNRLDTNNDNLIFSIDAYIRLYSSTSEVQIIPGVYLRDCDGCFRIEKDEILVTSNFSFPVGEKLHVCVNVNSVSKTCSLYVNNVKIDINVDRVDGADYPTRFNAFDGYAGEIFNFKIYRKNLLEAEILQNYSTGATGSNFSYFYLVTCFEASKAESVYADMESVRAKIILLKDEIALTAERVTSISGAITGYSVRYIRDYQEGNDKDKEKRWLEVQCFDSSDNNVLSKVIPTTDATIFENLQHITDSNREETYGVLFDVGLRYIEFDLDKIYKDIMYIKIWRYHKDFRTCRKTKTLVSDDGKRWHTLFDSSKTGEYVESAKGLVIPVNIGGYLDSVLSRLQSAELKITPEAITSTVMDSSRFTNFQSLIDQRANSLELSVTELQEGVNFIPYTDFSISDMTIHYHAVTENTIIEYREKFGKYKESYMITGSINGKFSILTPNIKTTLRSGSEYMFSVYCLADRGFTIDILNIVNFDGEKEDILCGELLNIVSDEKLERVNIIVTPKKDYIGASIEIGNSAGGGFICFDRFMLSKGDLLKDYQQSAEDIRVNFASINIKSNELALSVKEIENIESPGKNQLYYTDFEDEEAILKWNGDNITVIEVDDVLVGGKKRAAMVSCSSSVNKEYIYFETPTAYNLLADRYYTFSVFVQSRYNKKIKAFIKDDSQNEIEIGEFFTSSVITRFVTTFKVNVNIEKYSIVCKQDTVTEAGLYKGELAFLRCMVEGGFKVSAWIPSYEDLGQRVKSSEIKLKPDNVSVTVMESEKFSQYKQSVDAFLLGLQRKGQNNMLQNSKPRSNFEFWSAKFLQGYGVIKPHTGNEVLNGEYWNGGIWFEGNKAANQYMVLVNDSMNDLKFNINKKYSLVAPIYCDSNSFSVKLEIAKNGGTDVVTSTPYYKQNKGYTWSEHTFTPNTSGSAPDFRVIIADASNSNGACNFKLFIPWVNIYDGDIIYKSYMYPNSFIEGIVSVTTDGVKVQMNDGDGSQGYSLVGHDGVEVFENSGKRISHFGQGESAYIKTLSCDKIINRHAIKWRELCNVRFYVSTSSSGDGSGRDVNNKSNSINHTLNYIFENYGCYSKARGIEIEVGHGTYSENIYIGGWIGSGHITIFLNDNVIIYGSHIIEENTMPVLIQGTTSYNTWGNVGAKLFYRDSPNKNTELFSIRNSECMIYAIRAKKEGFNNANANWSGYDKNFANFTRGARGFVYNCDAVGFHDFIEAHHSSVVGVFNNKGHAQYFAYSSQGSIINVEGFVSLCSGKVAKDCSGIVNVTGTAPVTNSTWHPKEDPVTPPPPPEPPPPEWAWTQKTFSLYNLKTITEGAGSSTTNKVGQWGQGNWGVYQAHRGYADLGDAPSSWCSGARSFKAYIIMTRITSGGYSGEVPRPHIKKPNGQFWDCGVAFSHGQTKTIQLPSEITTAIANGSLKTLEMWVGKSEQMYSFYSSSSIKIECEKKV